MSHSAPLLAVVLDAIYYPCHWDGWGLVGQLSLKGNQSVNKSHLSLPKGLETEGRTLVAASCFRAWRDSRRQRGLWDT